MKTFLPNILYNRKKLVNHTPSGTLWEIQIRGWKGELDYNWGVEKCGHDAFGIENDEAANKHIETVYSRENTQYNGYGKNVSKKDETLAEMNSACSLSPITLGHSGLNKT